MAMIAAEKSNIGFKNIVKIISKVKPVNGRLEKIGKIRNNSKVILDYAHTPDALKTCLQNLKDQFKNIKRFINEKTDHPENRKFWRVSQWVSSGWLWFAWLQHDMANIAVFLPRQLMLGDLIMVLVSTILILGYVFYTGGGKIQEVVINKHGARFARSTTIINIVYAFVLYYFKVLNDLPMSTTWVFVGLLSGRELAISTVISDYRFKYVFPIIAKDFGKMMFGLGASVAIVLIIHQVIVPNGL